MMDRIGNRNHSRAAASGRDVTAMTTLSQNNSVAGSLVLNDYLNTSLQNTQVIGKETAVGRFEDPPAPDAGPLDHTLKPRSGNGGACSSLTQPRKVEEVVEVAAAGAFKTRCGRPLQCIAARSCSCSGQRPAHAASSSRPAVCSARVIEATAFRKFYERGDLPIAIHHAGLGNKLKWKVRPAADAAPAGAAAVALCVETAG